jgi:hypothetical protein
MEVVVKMTLATYVKDKIRGQSLRDVEKATESLTGAKVSRATLHQIITGLTQKPSPDTLAILATTFAQNDKTKTEEYYAEMMSLCGYLDLLPSAKVEVSMALKEEMEILSRLTPEVRAYAEGLKERHPEEYQEFLWTLASQKREATSHDNR